MRFCPQRRGERRFVDQRTAGGVDQHRSRFHLRQRRGVDQMAGLRRQRHVERDHVGNGEQLVEWQEGDAEVPLGRRIGPQRIEVDDVGGEGAGAGGDLPADPPQTDEADGLAGDLERRRAQCPLQPLAAAERGVGFEQPLVDREHQEEDVLGDADARPGRADRDRDAAGTSGGEIDIVVADPLVLDQAQPGCPADHLLRQARGGDQHEVGVGDGLSDRLALAAEADLEARPAPAPG